LGAVQVSDGGPSARRIAAVARSSGDVLAIYESGTRVAVRILQADGGVGAERPPSTSVATAVQRAELPALAVSGARVMEGWFETLPGPIHRLVVGEANANGEALVQGQPAISPIRVNPGAGQGLKLGLTASRLIVAWAHFDAAGANTSLNLSSCPIALDAVCTTQSVAANGRNPSLLVDGDTVFVGYEDGAGAHLVRANVPANGTVTLAQTVDFGSGTHDVVLIGTASALTIYLATSGSPQTLTRRSGDCTGPCNGLGTTTGVVTFTGAASSFSIEPRSTPPVLAWEEGPSGARFSRAMRTDSSTPVAVGVGSRRPLPLRFPGASVPTVLFDTEGGTNQIFRRGFCTF
jgi:hypothetical protein